MAWFLFHSTGSTSDGSHSCDMLQFETRDLLIEELQARHWLQEDGTTKNMEQIDGCMAIIEGVLRDVNSKPSAPEPSAADRAPQSPRSQ